MNILVTGATGFLGSRLIEHLVECDLGYHILATGRKFSHDNKIIDPLVRYTLGDLSDLDFVQTLFTHDIDVVINCASLSSPWGSVASFEQANIITQKYLIGESLKASIRRYIYISSPSIYFNFKDCIGIREVDPLPTQMVNQYAITKYAAEKLLEQSGLSYITLRPRALIGRGDTVIMPRLIRSHKEGKLKIMGSGDNVVDLTSVSNITQAIQLAIDTPYSNEAYNISNGEPIKLWDSINDVLRAIDMQAIQRKLPYWLLHTIAYCMETKARLLNSATEPILTRYSVGVLAKSFTFDITKARTKLGYQPTQNTQEAIKEFASWYKNVNHD